MAVISKEEFKKKITETGLTEEKQIELLEDIEDSWTEDVNEEYKLKYDAEKKEMEATIANMEANIAELKQRYKERFFSNEKIEKEEIEKTEIEEEKIIDVKEI